MSFLTPINLANLYRYTECLLIAVVNESVGSVHPPNTDITTVPHHAYLACYQGCPAHTLIVVTHTLENQMTLNRIDDVSVSITLYKAPLFAPSKEVP